jgi:hypothetical protein
MEIVKSIGKQQGEIEKVRCGAVSFSPLPSSINQRDRAGGGSVYVAFGL